MNDQAMVHIADQGKMIAQGILIGLETGRAGNPD